VFCLDWSKDGKYLVSGGQDGQIILWSADKGQYIKTIDGFGNSIKKLKWDWESSRILVALLDNKMHI